MRLIEKVHEIQRLSSLNLKVGLGRQVASKGIINWEVVSKDIENLRTKLSVFCAQEGIDVTKSEELHINLFASERQAMSGYPKLTFRTDIKLRIKVNPPWLGKPFEVMKQSQDISEADEFKGVATKKVMIHKQSNLLQLNPASEFPDKQRSIACPLH